MEHFSIFNFQFFSVQIPCASDSVGDDSIAIGLDFLSSLSKKSETVKEKEDPFLDWLLGPPNKK